MVVRRATTDDLVPLSEMGARFLAASPLCGAATLLEVRASLASIVREEYRAAWVDEHHGVYRGMLLAAVCGLWFAPAVRIATELAWWVDPEHRGSTAAVRLLEAFEAWAHSKGAVRLCMSTLPDLGTTAQRMLEERGYAIAEKSWVKEVG